MNAARLTMMIGSLLIVGALFAAPVPATSETSAACRDACYRSKSAEYQRCRNIPPADRAARVRCFQTADLSLRRCLRGCR
jgi:hypothetical protein